jgi:4-hydroxy 2-oxovalerate aldolase
VRLLLSPKRMPAGTGLRFETMTDSRPTITICDATLRDGSHAYSHKINLEQVNSYAMAAEAAGFSFLEVGHGNGLGASSLQVGESLVPEGEMLRAAKKCLRHTKLAVHVMPGFATIKREIVNAMEAGVDLFRVGSHCTEADITQRHIGYVRSVGREAWGVLMMSHMVSKEVLLEEARKMQSYGAQGIMLMDSAGAFFPSDVTAKIELLAGSLEVPVGFHAHNNLGLSIANSLAALEAGARIIDGTSKGFGAGAGNAPLELLAAVLKQRGYLTSIDLYRALDAAELAAKLFAGSLPNSNGITIVSGLSGVFSGFAKPVQRAAEQLGVDPRDVFFELGRRKVVGGQEDLILEVATDLARHSNPGSKP